MFALRQYRRTQLITKQLGIKHIRSMRMGQYINVCLNLYVNDLQIDIVTGQYNNPPLINLSPVVEPLDSQRVY